METLAVNLLSVVMFVILNPPTFYLAWASGMFLLTLILVKLWRTD